jgi:MFS-type transporter involved in bile tolerance (Atg22 family)
VAFLGGASLYEANPAFPFWLGSVLVLASSLLVFFFIKEPKAFEMGEEKPSMLRSLEEVIRDNEKSALRMLLAIFCWFVGYNAIEAFFTLYAKNHLGMTESDGARLLGHLSLIFVIFALPAGYIGAKAGRRRTILTGISLMIAMMLAIFFLPAETLSIPLTKLPVLGTLPVISLFLMGAGVAWALININSLPMVVDMTDATRLGTFTGLYYLSSTLAAIVGPNVNGWIIALSGENYNSIMLVGPLFFAFALILMLGVRRGEAVIPAAPASAGD